MSTLVEGPVTGGRHGWPFGAAAFDLGAMGYVEDEWFLEGNAQCYAHAEGTGRSFDGRWTAEPAATVGYKTRILVRRPADPDDFNGTVVLFWSNVSVGFEIFTGESPELYRGFAFVGVTTQRVAVHSYPEGPSHGLAAWDPERYATLHIPSDDASYDIFTQAARVVGPERPVGPADPMGGYEVRRVVAFGASQSAGRLATYLNAVQPLAREIDGFLLDVYFGNGSLLCRVDAAGPEVTRLDQITTMVSAGMRPGGHLLRDDLVPVFVVNSESEAIAHFPVRQPDGDTYRFWELAGYAHGTVPRRHGLVSSWERDLGVTRHPLAPSSGYNTLSLDPVRSAALHHLQAWLREGTPPPRAPGFIEIVGDPPSIARDDDGNARGGIRMPDLDVPTARHSGSAADGSLSLFGSSVPFSAARLRSLYPSEASFVSQYRKAVDAAVDAGFLLAIDADAVVEEALARRPRPPHFGKTAPMIRFSVFYPTTEGASFDHDYYRDHHVPLAVKTWGVDGAAIDHGLSGPYVAAVHFEFESQDALNAALSSEDTSAVLADVANYTTITPVMQTSEIVS